MEPGEHHLCAGWQTASVVGTPSQVAALHFTVEAGRVYYFSTRNFWLNYGPGAMKFEPVDSDEGNC